MAFEQIFIKPRTGTSGPSAAFTDQVVGGVREARKTPLLVLDIGHELISKLGWDQGETVILSIGTGSDLGKLRLAPAAGSPGGRELVFSDKNKNRRFATGISRLIVAMRRDDGEPIFAGLFKPVILTREVLQPASGSKGELFLTVPRAWVGRV